MSVTSNSLPWTTEVWDKIRTRVLDVFHERSITEKILPRSDVSSGTPNVPANEIENSGAPLRIKEGKFRNYIITSVQFSLTKTQLEQEQQLQGALTLAEAAAALSSATRDKILFQGDNITSSPPISVHFNDEWKGILELAAAASPVEAKEKDDIIYGPRIVKAVADAIAQLLKNNQNGPYTFVCSPDISADAHTPIAGTSASEPINSLVENRFYVTGALPERHALVLSIPRSGYAMDYVTAGEPTTEFLFVNDKIEYCFHVLDRFIPRLKFTKAAIKIPFEPPKP